MKTTYLLASLVFMMNAFAQSNYSPIKGGKLQSHNAYFKDPKTTHGDFPQYDNNKTNLPMPMSLIALDDSVYNWKLDTITMAWKLNYKEINFVYDSQNNNTSYLFQTWNGSAWVNLSQRTYSYDANNNNTNFMYQTWNGSIWVNSGQQTKTYNANNRITNQIYQSWNGSTWVNQSQQTMTYDANNNYINWLDQNWNGSMWVNFDQSIFSYNVNNKDSNDLQQNWNGTTWVNVEQYSYTYNANNKMIGDLQQSWSGTAWVNQFQYTYTFSINNNDSTEFIQQWSGTNWNNNTEVIFTYNGNNKITNMLVQYWNGSTWVNNSQQTDTYDVNNLQKSHVNRDFNIAGVKTIGADSTVYYFNTVTGIKTIAENNNQVSIYPNPTNGQFTIETNSMEKQTVQVFDMNGRLVLSQNINGKTNIDAMVLNEGVYHLVIKTGNIVVNKKLVIVR